MPSASPSNVRITHAQGSIAQFSWDEIPCGSRGGRGFYYTYTVLVNGVEQRSGQTSDSSIAVFDLPNGRVEFRVAGATQAGMGLYSEITTLNVVSSGNLFYGL